MSLLAPCPHHRSENEQKKMSKTCRNQELLDFYFQSLFRFLSHRRQNENFHIITKRGLSSRCFALAPVKNKQNVCLPNTNELSNVGRIGWRLKKRQAPKKGFEIAKIFVKRRKRFADECCEANWIVLLLGNKGYDVIRRTVTVPTISTSSVFSLSYPPSVECLKSLGYTHQIDHWIVKIFLFCSECN